MKHKVADVPPGSSIFKRKGYNFSFRAEADIASDYRWRMVRVIDEPNVWVENKMVQPSPSWCPLIW